jgi:DNA polymerase-3 subunit epsilon
MNHRNLYDLRLQRKGNPMDFGLVLDVETTGINAQNDRIIEIGILEFSVKQGELPQITRTYGALQDPGMPLPKEIEQLTGLTDGMLKGQMIDWDMVRSMVESASVIVAHNADFDRQFMEASGQLLGLSCHWACSLRHIDWRGHGYRQLGLTYLAADHGFLNPFAHRAIFDCATTFRLIAPHLPELISRSYEKEFTVHALSSPFESKDTLKKRGYIWDPSLRCWVTIVPESKLEEERTFLAQEVYKGPPKHRETPKDRD